MKKEIIFNLFNSPVDMFLVIIVILAISVGVVMIDMGLSNRNKANHVAYCSILDYFPDEPNLTRGLVQKACHKATDYLCAAIRQGTEPTQHNTSLGFMMYEYWIAATKDYKDISPYVCQSIAESLINNPVNTFIKLGCEDDVHRIISALADKLVEAKSL